MLGSGRLHVLLDSCNIIGFIESWRLTPEQLGRLLCDNFSALEENVTEGEVLWISDIWVRDYKRQGEILPKLISKLLSTNKDAKFGASQRTKGRIKLYDKDTWFKHFNMELNKEQ
jgi:hypothetical protein